MAEITEEDRTTPLGIVGFSIAYFSAAVAAHSALEKSAPACLTTAPVYNLMGQSIELALKSYVRQQGGDLTQLLHLRHDLVNALTTAQTLGLVHSINRDELVILNREYSTHRFRYIKTGAVQLLEADALFRLGAAVLEPCMAAIPDAWKFLWQPEGKLVVDGGWLSAMRIKQSCVKASS